MRALAPTPGLLLACMVAALALAGCAGGSSPEAATTVSVEAAESSATGTIRGKVLDDEQRPAWGATVELNGTGASATTGSAGDFGFGNVPVGTHDLVVSMEGFETARARVEVADGREVSLEIFIFALPADSAHYEVFPFVGHQQCMWYSAAFKSSCTYPYTALYWTAHGNGVNLTNYGAPEDVSGTQYRYNFTVRGGSTGIVSELAWEAATEAAKYYQLELSCAWYDPVVDDCVAPGQTTWDSGNTYARARGVSPLRIEWQFQKMEWMPWVMSRAYLSSDASLPAAVAFEQKVEMYNAVFYGGPVPRDFSLAAPTP